jgi:hypothetical protein
MRNAVWIPRVCLAASFVAMTAVGVRAKADTCVAPAPLAAGSPGVAGWAGPPSIDGGLDDGAVPSYAGDIWTTVGVDNSALPAPFSYTSITAAYTDQAGCLAFDAQGHQAEHDCLCKSCLSLMQQCDSMPGCRAVWKCSADSGCTNANTCYLYPPAPCVIPINQYGTGSVDVATVQALGTCGMGASPACPTQ